MVVLHRPGRRTDKGEIGVIGLRLIDEPLALGPSDRRQGSVFDGGGALPVTLEHRVHIELSHGFNGNRLKPLLGLSAGSRLPASLGAPFRVEALKVDVGVVDELHRFGKEGVARDVPDRTVHLVGDRPV